MVDNRLPVKRTITLNGITTEYSLSGENGPVIVLVNGFRMPMTSWDKLYPEIQSCGRIFAYNRHGVGKTSKASCPQTGEEVIKSLESVLQAMDLPPPYILVAHSLGGIFTNLYARINPTSVSAVIFVDAAHPDEKQTQKEFKPPFLVRLVTGGLKMMDTLFDKYQHSEDECIDETLQQIMGAGDFPPIPIAVITGGKKMPLAPDASFAAHLQCQKLLTTLSPDSVQIVAENSGHFPQITEPELVVNAIKDIVMKTKNR